MRYFDFNHKEFYWQLRNFFDTARDAMHFTKDGMAKRTGMTVTNLSALYSGKTPIDSFPTLGDLCHSHNEKVQISIGKHSATNRIELKYIWNGSTPDLSFFATLGNRMASLRQQRGWSQMEMALRVGNLNYSSPIGKIERAVDLVKISTLVKYLRVLDTRLIVTFE